MLNVCYKLECGLPQQRSMAICFARFTLTVLYQSKMLYVTVRKAVYFRVKPNQDQTNPKLSNSLEGP